jgi:hypothetical protein
MSAVLPIVKNAIGRIMAEIIVINMLDSIEARKGIDDTHAR